jgi:hypothetical protein
MRATGNRVSSSSAFRMLGRTGLIARSVIYILVGALATQIAFGGSGGKEADRQGALQTVAQTPGGTVLLWLLAVGLAGMALALQRGHLGPGHGRRPQGDQAPFVPGPRNLLRGRLREHRGVHHRFRRPGFQ